MTEPPGPAGPTQSLPARAPGRNMSPITSTGRRLAAACQPEWQLRWSHESVRAVALAAPWRPRSSTQAARLAAAAPGTHGDSDSMSRVRAGPPPVPRTRNTGRRPDPRPLPARAPGRGQLEH